MVASLVPEEDKEAEDSTAKPMSEDRLRSVVQGKIVTALGGDQSALSRDRSKAMRYYRGEKFGNEVEGRSQIISRDVAEVVDGMVPGLMKPFVSGDQAVKYDPRGPEDEPGAEQASDYANYIWNVDNPGFRIIHDWIKDGLLARVGVVKIWWQDIQETIREEYAGLTQDELTVLASDPAVISVEASTEDQAEGQEPTFGAVVRRQSMTGRIRVRNVPPDEFLIEDESVEFDAKPTVIHRCRRSISDLRKMGYAAEKLDQLAGSDSILAQEAQERARPEQEQMGSDPPPDDDSQREVWVSEAYTQVDFDGDGIGEYRKVTLAGDNGEVMLDHEEVEDHPFAHWCPYPIPHKFHGESVADKVMDVQLTKSAILRQMLDNLYLINNARTEIVEGKVNLDDFLSSKPGGYVRVKESGAMREIAVPPVFQNAFPALEYLDTVRENRSGSTKYNQGLDSESLNKTATGINRIMGAAMQRQELTARCFAEMGMKRAFRITLKLMTTHQDKPRTIRLRDKWVEIDPRSWNAEMDVNITVGLGTGDKDQQLGHLMAIWDKQIQAMQVQGGPGGPLVTMQNLYETGCKIVANSGLKGEEKFFSDPAKAPPQPPQPDPEMVKVQGQLKAEQAKTQGQLQLQAQRQQGELALKAREQNLKAAHGAYQPPPAPTEPPPVIQ